MTLTNLASPAATRRLVLLPPGARRTYWSFRCGKPSRTLYQYWGTIAPNVQRARHRHWTLPPSEKAHDSHGRRHELEEAPRPDLDKSRMSSKGHPMAYKTGKSKDTPSESVGSSSSTHPAQENKVQCEEQRILLEEWSAWEKAARTHASARLEMLRFALEKDPYQIMFGGREARGVWNPWRHGFWRWPNLVEKWSRRSTTTHKSLEADGDPKTKVTGESATKDGRPPMTEGETKKSEPMDDNVMSQRGHDLDIKLKDKQDAISIPSVQSGDIYIDLITLRKVRRESAGATAALQSPSPLSPELNEDAINIPIKTFKANSTVPRDAGKDISANPPSKFTKRSTKAGFAAQDWLRREGFSLHSDSPSVTLSRPAPTTKPQSPAPNVVYMSPLAKSVSNTVPVPCTQSAHLQSTLERWQAKKPHKNSFLEPSTSHSVPGRHETDIPRSDVVKAGLKHRVVYNPQEDTTEDIDLLRASDVRAASGKVKPAPKAASPNEIAQRRHELATKFAESQHRFELELRNEIIDSLENDTIPTKSPLWAFWMQYDQLGRKDWLEWQRKKSFTLNGENEIKDMQYKSRAFMEQMPSPAEIFASGGTTLSRYLNANQISIAMKAIQSAFNRWHMEMQSVLIPRGVEPFSQDVIDNLRKALTRYHIELRRQILTGKGPHIVPSKTHQKQIAADKILAKEVADQRAAMQKHEEKPRSSVNQLRDKTAFVPWSPPEMRKRAIDVAKAAAKAENDARLSRELREIYEARYGKISPQHRQPKPIAEVGKDDTDVEGQRFVWDEPELLKQSPFDQDPTAHMHNSSPVPASPVPSKNETPTVLLTLARRTGTVTTHPSTIWPTLKPQLPVGASPLESPALCAFLKSSTEPQRVLREVVSLQARGFRLTSGRKGCLVFQQAPAINTFTTQNPANTDEVRVEPKPPTQDSLEKLATLPVSRPIPFVTSNRAPKVLPTAASNKGPSPSQPIRRSEAIFTGQSGLSSSQVAQPGKRFDNADFGRRDSKLSSASHSNATSSSRGSKNISPPLSHPSRRSRRRMRRLARGFVRIMRSALLMALGAYVAGLWLEWRRERRRERQQQWLLADGGHGLRNGTADESLRNYGDLADKIEPLWRPVRNNDALPSTVDSNSGSRTASPALVEWQNRLERCWDRVWWLWEAELPRWQQDSEKKRD